MGRSRRLVFHTFAPEVAIEDLKEIYRQRDGNGKRKRVMKSISDDEKIGSNND